MRGSSLRDAVTRELARIHSADLRDAPDPPLNRRQARRYIRGRPDRSRRAPRRIVSGKGAGRG